MNLGIYGSDISIKDLSNLPKYYEEESVIMNINFEYLKYTGNQTFVLLSNNPSDYLRNPIGPWFNSLYSPDCLPKYSYLKTIKNWVCSNF
jgi:hypothetical protein